MWIQEQLLGRGIEIALLGASADHDDRRASDTDTDTDTDTEAPTAREKR